MLKLINETCNKIKSNPIYVYILLYFTFLLVLSLFRNANADETYYLKETTLIAELLRNGIWIGDYGVGLHGFLFKLPVAILFMLTGEPSVFLATLFTIILNIASLLLFYKIVRKYFLNEKYAMWATILFSVAFHFIETSISFNRDIPAVFTVLLFIYLFLKNANMWLIGISLLFMLDAKEHVFFTVAPLYAVFILINQVSNIKKGNIGIAIKDVLGKLLSGYILPIIWIILMLTTSIIPINMFVASISGLTHSGLDWNKEQFSTEAASQNLIGETGKEIPEMSDLDVSCGEKESGNEGQSNLKKDSITSDIKYEKQPFLCVVADFIDIIGGYIGKTLYPRTLSFISIPKIIALPAIIHAISLFLSWWRKKDKKYILPMILLFNVLVIIFRSSHGRYLLGVTPLFILFFILFIRDCLKKPKYFKNVLISTTIFVLLGLLFESTFVGLKIILELSLLILFWAIWYFRNKSEHFVNTIKFLFLSALSVGMFLTSLAFSLEIGQISSYFKYGYNRETESIIKEIKPQERLWINEYGSGDLINVYRKNYFNEPEWYWQLSDLVPKKGLLKTYTDNNTYTSDLVDIEEFKKYLENYEITKVALTVSTLKEDKFPAQDKLDALESEEWLKFEKRIELRNKVLYIFKVEN